MKWQKRSLFGAVAGALSLTAAFVPRANATVIVYFNFEDGTLGSTVDFVADVNNGLPPPAGNLGGGTQASTITPTGGDFVSDTGLLLNRTVGDQDTANPGLALTYNHASQNPDPKICFNVNTSFLVDLSLSMAIDNAGNGYNTVKLTYTTNFGEPGAVTHDGGSQLIPNATVNKYTFNLDPTVFTGDGSTHTTQFCLTFSGGQSNGNNRQFVIDNIVLGGTEVPEPATVAGGLLAACGLCWHQRRRLVRSLRLRPA